MLPLTRHNPHCLQIKQCPPYHCTSHLTPHTSHNQLTTDAVLSGSGGGVACTGSGLHCSDDDGKQRDSPSIHVVHHLNLKSQIRK